MGQISDRQVTRLASLVVALQELVDSLRADGIILTPEQLARIEKFRQESRCLFCGEALAGETRRGCHQACYNKLKTRIDKGEITTQEAVDKGWFNPTAEKPGRKSTLPDPMRRPKVAANKPTHPRAARVAEKMSRDIVRDKSRPKTR